MPMPFPEELLDICLCICPENMTVATTRGQESEVYVLTVGHLFLWVSMIGFNSLSV